MLGVSETSLNLLLLLVHRQLAFRFLPILSGHLPNLWRIIVTITLVDLLRCIIGALLLLQTVQVGTYVEGRLGSNLLLLVKRYLMVELLQEQLRVVQDILRLV